MTRRLVVVGGDAGGMSAASQARRSLGPDQLEIVAIERGDYTSYSACGIPYWVGGLVESADDLIARTPEEFRSGHHVDVRMRGEVVDVDPARGEVTLRDVDTSSRTRLGYDDLLIATGARPRPLAIPGAEAPGVHHARTIDEGESLRKELATLANRDARGDAAEPAHAVVVGGGYIGLELAEALVGRGLAVTLLHSGPEPMNTLDPDMGVLVRRALEAIGVTVVTDARVREVGVGAGGRAERVRADTGTHAVDYAADYPADLVVLGTGVQPNVGLAEAAGIAIGSSGGIETDAGMRSVSHPGVWAAGDCVETWNRISGRRQVVALGTHANRQGRVAGTNIGGGTAEFAGVLGTAITKVGDCEIARTGLSEAEAAAAGFDPHALVTESRTRSGYYPGSAPVAVKIVAERGTGRLLGAQIVGGSGAGKRVDSVAVALWAGLDVAELAMADLSYAPPFSPTIDPVSIACRRLAEGM